MDQRHTIRQHILDAYWCNRVDRPRRCGPLFHLKNQERATRPRARVPKKRTGIRNGNFAQPRPQSALGDASDENIMKARLFTIMVVLLFPKQI